MKKLCTLFLRMSFLFYILLPSPGITGDFSVVEFDRLLRAHPLMRKFDEKTGRFRGTPSEAREVAAIASEIASLDRDQAAEEQRRSGSAGRLLLASDPFSTDISAWNAVREGDERIAELRKRRAALTELMRIEGAPEADTLAPLVTGLVQDLLASCPRTPDGLLLNRLPRFPSAPPVVEIRPPDAAGGPGTPERLEQIIRAAPVLGPLFPSSDRPILYPEEASHP